MSWKYILTKHRYKMKQNTYILVNGTIITMEAYRESYGRD